MSDLLPAEKGKPGRRRTVTANAWISRRDKNGPWKSHVYAGSRRVHVLSTGTNHQRKALDFNRCHLLQVLNNTKPSATSEEVQLMLDHGS